MAESSFFRKHWEGWKDFWGERFSFLESYTRFTDRDSPLPSWSAADVDEFIASDPVHGPALKTAREAVNYAAIGSVLGAVTTAGFTWKYSRSLHGYSSPGNGKPLARVLNMLKACAGLSFAAGAVFGWTFGQEIASHSLQLYRLDTMAAQVKFLEWWENKTGGH